MKQLTQSETARHAGVTLGALGNWIRRNPEFPQPVRSAGRDRFNALDVAAWLDRHRIPRNKLRKDERYGTTYGMRFRKSTGLGVVPESQADDDLGAALWQMVQTQRGAIDIQSIVDVAIALLYLSATDAAAWSFLAQPDASSYGVAMKLEQIVHAHRPDAPYLAQVLLTRLAEKTASHWLVPMIRMIDDLIEHDGVGQYEYHTGREGAAVRYLLEKFAVDDDRRLGQFLTPASVVRLAVKCVAPQPGDSVYDPCCGPGAFLMEAANYVRRTGHDPATASYAGKALNERSWQIANMSVRINDARIEPDIRLSNALQSPPHAKQFDVVLVNPPFNMTNWTDWLHPDDRRWRFGLPPTHNANFAWIQYVAASLAKGGRAAVVMPSGAGYSENPQERSIRAALLEAGVVEALVALPQQLFRATAVPVTLWLLGHPDARQDREVLLVDATGMGTVAERGLRMLTDVEVNEIVQTYKKWRDTRSIADVHYAASVSYEAARLGGYRLNPRAYVTARPTLDRDVLIQRVREQRHKLHALHLQSVEVDGLVAKQLERISI